MGWPYSLDPFSASWFERPFGEDEVFQLVRGMVKDKALGPDGFSMGSFQICWEIVKKDLMWVFQNIFSFKSLKNLLMPPSLLSFTRNQGHLSSSIFIPLVS